MSPFLKAFIAISVLMNLFLAGIVAGDASRYLVGPTTHKQVFQDMAASLPADKQKPFLDTMQRAEQETADMRKRLTEERKKAFGLLKADPFDKQAYLTQTQAIRQLKLQIMQHMAEALAQSSEPLSPSERSTLVDMLSRLHHPE